MIQEAINRYLQNHQPPQLSPKAVLFDMDGVLYDSMRFHAKAWKEVSEKHHLKATIEDFYLFEGRTGEGTINELFLRTFNREATEEEKKSIYKEKAYLFNQYNDGTPMPGAAELLNKVKAYGIQRVLVTGSGQKTLIDKLEHSYPGIFSPEKMARIKRYASAGNKPFREMEGLFSWELLVAIPFDLVGLDGEHLPEAVAANFYKCADGSSLPHYLSWSPIPVEKPDFHRPEYFGELRFK